MKAVLVVEMDVAEGGFNEAAAPLMEAIRGAAPAAAARVVACIAEDAERVVAALNEGGA